MTNPNKRRYKLDFRGLLASDILVVSFVFNSSNRYTLTYKVEFHLLENSFDTFLAKLYRLMNNNAMFQSLEVYVFLTS